MQFKFDLFSIYQKEKKKPKLKSCQQQSRLMSSNPSSTGGTGGPGGSGGMPPTSSNAAIMPEQSQPVDLATTSKQPLRIPSVPRPQLNPPRPGSGVAILGNVDAFWPLLVKATTK